jgi:hypothetical protein
MRADPGQGFRVLDQRDEAHRAAAGGAGEHVDRERSPE